MPPKNTNLSKLETDNTSRMDTSQTDDEVSEVTHHTTTPRRDAASDCQDTLMIQESPIKRKLLCTESTTGDPRRHTGEPSTKGSREHSSTRTWVPTFCMPTEADAKQHTVRFSKDGDKTLQASRSERNMNEEAYMEMYDTEPCKAKQLQDRLDVEAKTSWIPVALVNAQCSARTRRYPPKRYRAEGEFLVPVSEAEGLEPLSRPFPLGNQVPHTETPQEPTKPPPELVEEVEKVLPSWEACISQCALQRLQQAVRASERDEKASRSEGAWARHRPRAIIGSATGEVRIGIDDYHPTLLKVLRAGHTLRISEKGVPSIREVLPPEKEDWGFKADALRQAGEAIGWPDKEILFFLKWGVRDFSDKTPPICSFSPHQKKALTSSGAFQKVVQKEIDAGWISEPQACPTAMPFRISPGSVEDKKDGSKRLVWNGSWPKPGTLHSYVSMNGEPWLPVSTNANTSIPEHILAEWAAIETNNEMIAIMAEGAKYAGMTLYGRTYDLKKWFRQLAVNKAELWKCVVHANGGFREDRRMQMGRASSSHSGQRVSLLLVNLMQRAASSEGWGLKGDKGSKDRKLEEWINDRRNRFPRDPVQVRTVSIEVYQDDLTVVAIGEKAAQDAEEGIPRICEERYGVLLTKKEEANKPFALSLSSIGATYDLQNLDHIICRPTKETHEKYQSLVSSLEMHRGKLVPYEDIERLAGLQQFISRFLENGELLCNSAYVCLRAGNEIATSKKLAPYSKDLSADARRILRRLKENRFPAITRNPCFVHPGIAGANSDASGGCNADGRGWGVCVMGWLACGEWSQETQDAIREGVISIGPLELLGSAIALDVGAKTKMISGNGSSIVLRNDNESACTVINSGRAGSGPMLEALRIFTKVREKLGLTVRMQHIQGIQNVIADHLSRGRKLEAEARASSTWKVRWTEPPSETEEWVRRIIRAGWRARARARASQGPNNE